MSDKETTKGSGSAAGPEEKVEKTELRDLEASAQSEAKGGMFGVGTIARVFNS